MEKPGMQQGDSPGGPGSASRTDPLATRRRVLNVLLGGSLVSWIAVVFFPVLKYLRPPPETAGGGETAVGDDDKHKIAQTGFAIVRLGTDRVIVFQDAEKTLHALSAKCTHEGCTVAFKTDEDLVWCACHNGKFAIDGRVISGPPPRPLAAYAVKGSLSGNLTVSRAAA
jgi:cytochrome b6-f complex iron-sulfur subunit